MKLLRKILYPLYHKFQVYKRKRYFLNNLNMNPLRIVVGSGKYYEKAWLPTDIEYLNMLELNDWLKYFQPNSIDAILSEHVWEHLTEEQGQIAANNCFEFLKPGAYLRLAVPDGYHASKDYIEYVKPGGKGPGASDHKILYNFDTLQLMLERAGFQVLLIEGYLKDGIWIEKPWMTEDGMIKRSKRYKKMSPDRSFQITSIIVDACKPLI